MGEEIDHEYTAEVVCPYCGYEFHDSWELDDTGDIECGSCEREFTFNRYVDVTYCTEEI